MSETPEISVYESTFAQSDKTDAILVVDGKKLHVNKALLSYHSDYFNTLFNGEFKEKSMPEIPIEDVEFEDFATLLSLVHHNPMELSYGNAENILKLADRFLLPAAKRHVELFIWTTSEFSSLDKLVFADKYNLDTLLQKTLELYATEQKEFYHLDYSPARLLSTELKAKLFDIIKMSETPEMSIYESAFAKSDETDAILVVGQKKLHVNKTLLSHHSDYFKKLFNGDFKERSMPEIPIEDVEFEDFATLLSLVQRNPIVVEDDFEKFENLLKLARSILNASRRNTTWNF
ncbi:hypothetical protein CRE_19795 [Caenorhabditis remanei]|uniref:BTB domain-containing protein n=1 Tax=Caenorhabditis remanei TaxID=31234 RepID=E3MTC1_CAERE|nr:hypothetical protein CRE_19795 [Caenorhabditis remanei]